MVQSLSTIYYDGVIDQKSNLTLIAGGVASRIVDSTGAVFVQEGKKWKKLKHYENFEFVDARTGEKYKVTYECKETGKETSTTCTVTKPSCSSSSTCTSSSTDCCVTCPTGPTGPRGPTGFTGYTGSAVVPGFAYIYNISDVTETIADGDAIPFSANGPLLGATHVAGSTDLVVGATGTYELFFSVTAIQNDFPSSRNNIGVYLNGTLIPGSTYTVHYLISSTEDPENIGQNTGSVIFTANNGDTITLVNQSNTSIILTSAPGIGTEPNVDASITLRRLL